MKIKISLSKCLKRFFSYDFISNMGNAYNSDCHFLLKCDKIKLTRREDPCKYFNFWNCDIKYMSKTDELLRFSNRHKWDVNRNVLQSCYTELLFYHRSFRKWFAYNMEEEMDKRQPFLFINNEKASRAKTRAGKP